MSKGPAPRPGIMAITPYVGGESAIEGQGRIIKLSSNENAFGPSPKAIKAYRALAPEMHRYPDGGATGLRRALAKAWKLDAERIVCGAELVEADGNVVMLRTFSKIYGLGGLRLGWGYFPVHVADVLNRLRGPFNVSSAALAAGEAALADVAFVDKVRAHTEQWREWTMAEARALGLTVTPGIGNFLLIHFPVEKGRDAAAADAFLKSRGVIVRRMERYGLGHCLRATIGREDEMRAFIAALAQFTGAK